jgi:hypothetical protein
MSNYIYNLSPNTLLFVLSGLFFVGAFLLLRTFNLFWPAHSRIEHNDVAGVILGVFGVTYAVILGAVAVGAWEKANSLGDQIVSEVSASNDVYRLSKGLNATVQAKLQNSIKKYLKVVIEDEWPVMQAGGIPAEGLKVYNQMIEDLAGYQPGNSAEQIFLDHILTNLDQLEDARRARILASLESLSPILYEACLIGSSLVLVVCVSFGLKSHQIHSFFLLLLSFSMATVLTVIIVLDRPLMGAYQIGPDKFKTALFILEHG